MCSYMRHMLSVSSFREDTDLLLPDFWSTTNLKLLETKFLESSYIAYSVNPGPRSAWGLYVCYESSEKNFFPYPEPQIVRVSFFLASLCVPSFSRSLSQ